VDNLADNLKLVKLYLLNTSCEQAKRLHNPKQHKLTELFNNWVTH